MNADPFHEILVLLALLAGYTTVSAAVWMILCSRSRDAVRQLNDAVAARRGAVFASTNSAEPDLHATLTALLAEQRMSPKIAARLRRIAPVFHHGKWVVYPSSAYWAHRFERLRSR